MLEHMFGTLDGTVDQQLERRREARRRRLRVLAEQQARDAQETTQIVRAADDDGDWQAAGFSSSAAWFAQVSSSDHRTAVRITSTASALRALPALDQALGSGMLTLDQVAAAAEFATPATEVELVRVAVGRAPSAIGLVARKLAPPVVGDDQTLYARRSLSMTWTQRAARALPQRPAAARAGRRLRAGDLGHRQDAARRGQAGRRRARLAAVRRGRARHARPPDACEVGGVRRSPTTLIVHLSDDEPPFLEGAGPISPETAERLGCDARRLTIKLTGRDLVHSRVGRCASYAQMRALHKRSDALSVPGLHRHPRARSPPPRRRQRRRRDRARQPDPALPATPHTAPRQPHPYRRQRRAPHLRRPGRTRHHRQPTTRTAWLATGRQTAAGERRRLGTPAIASCPQAASISRPRDWR